MVKRTAALWSPESGIVDSHELMASLALDIEEQGGALVLGTRVTRIDPNPDGNGWVVQTKSKGEAEPNAVLAQTVINASGLSFVTFSRNARVESSLRLKGT